MTRIVLLLTIIISLPDIPSASPSANAFLGNANQSGPRHPTPAHHGVKYYFRVWPGLQTTKRLPSPRPAVSRRPITSSNADSFKTTASRRIASSAGTVASSSTTPSPRPAKFPGIAVPPIPFHLPVIPPLSIVPNLPGPLQLSSQKTAASRRDASTTKKIASPETTPSINTRTSPRTTPSTKTRGFPRTTSSTRTTASPGTASSRKSTVFRKTRSSTWTTASPPKTSSAAIDNTTEEISWKPKNLQKFAGKLEKECDFDLLDAISEDLKILWDEVKKEREEPMSGRMNDMRTLLKRIIDLYNDCSEQMPDIDSERQWEIYLKTFGKEYNANATEKEVRKGIFKKNKEEVKEHNELYKKGRATYKAGLNHLSDRTEEELKRMNGFRATNATPRGHPKRKARFVDEPIRGNYSYNPNITAPASFDWRTKGSYITPVTNQGDCSACYAFAGIGALEAYHKKNAGELVRLSVQNILDCTWHFGNNGCVDGTTDTVFHYAERIGVVSNFHYPYTMNASHNCRWRRADVVANDRGYYVVEHDSELALQSAVAIQGPVAASIGTRHLFRHHSGIFAAEDCGDINHAILIVGYGTDPRHGDFWIVKNCWGYWWGEDGYFRIARNRNNMCNIASYALFPY